MGGVVNIRGEGIPSITAPKFLKKPQNRSWGRMGGPYDTCGPLISPREDPKTPIQTPLSPIGIPQFLARLEKGKRPHKDPIEIQLLLLATQRHCTQTAALYTLICSAPWWQYMHIALTQRSHRDALTSTHSAP